VESGVDPKTGESPLDAFRLNGNGRHEFNMANLYVYFWRWATWKVFEGATLNALNPPQPGIVCFITATGYLAGPGFKGMREYLRRNSSRGWIINVTPEGKQPPPKSAIFNIETPVAIALFVRDEQNDANVPAVIRYAEVYGTRDEKFEKLSALSLKDQSFRLARSSWTSPFTPASSSNWDSFPALDDLLPWFSTGVTPNRRWVTSPSRALLQERWRDLLLEPDVDIKRKKLKETRDTTLEKTKKALPGDDAEKETRDSLSSLLLVENPTTILIAYRSFDRQFMISDSRVLDMPRPALWHARIDGQIYVNEQHSIHPGSGPAVIFSELLPDINAFNNRGGRVLARFHPDGSSNVAPGLETALGKAYHGVVNGSDLVFYIAALSANPAFTAVFNDELTTPGVRIPITADSALWDRSVRVGKSVIWWQTFGSRGEIGDASLAAEETPKYDVAVGSTLPEGATYDPTTRVISLGQGRWSNVNPAVWDYKVGGVGIIESWVGYRRKVPKGKKTSPLDYIQETHWNPDWSGQFHELLLALTHLVHLEDEQEALLQDVLAGSLLDLSSLQKLGVEWPKSASDRKVRYGHLDDMLDIE
jgi:hypothetical protein